jgi:hypothetical protein
MGAFTDQAALAVAYLVAWASRRVRPVGQWLDAEQGVVTDMALDRLKETVEAQLAAELAELAEEAQNGHVSDLARVRLQVALEHVASRDMEFQRQITELIARLREAEPRTTVQSVTTRNVDVVVVFDGDVSTRGDGVAGTVRHHHLGGAASGRGSGAPPSTAFGEPPASGWRDDASADDVVRIPVSIYLAESGIHEEVETAVEQWLTTADVSIRTRDEPVIGSWFRRMEAGVKKAASTPGGREALLTAMHIADSRLVQGQDAYVTTTLLQNVGPVLQALQPTKDAVVRAGALLIVKIDWVVQVHQLTAAQQAILDHQPHLVDRERDFLTAGRVSRTMVYGIDCDCGGPAARS